MFFCLVRGVANAVISWLVHVFVTPFAIIWWLNIRSPPVVVAKKSIRLISGCNFCQILVFVNEKFRKILEFCNILNFQFDFCQSKSKAIAGA